jgi:hypothetical protein
VAFTFYTSQLACLFDFFSFVLRSEPAARARPEAEADRTSRVLRKKKECVKYRSASRTQCETPQKKARGKKTQSEREKKGDCWRA